MSRSDPRPTGRRTCRKCGVAKPVDAFYEHTNGKTEQVYVSRTCIDCDNARTRIPTTTRMVRNRARNRAYAALAAKFPDEFAALYQRELTVAKNEQELLAYMASERGDAKPEVVRLKSGPARKGQGVIDRIDVARCPDCHTYHDRGHQCPACHPEEENHAQA